MAEKDSIIIPAHYNIYNGSTGRNLRIDYSLPSQGVTAETGLLLLVPGYGGNIDSNVYKKMRDVFADQYNLVTVQCTYFGDSFMQNVETFTFSNNDQFAQEYLTKDEQIKVQENPALLIKYLSNFSIKFPLTATINETLDEFNDMGFMQAIDLITSIDAVKIILRENHLPFDEQKVLGYGHSHGAYLLHLCNRLEPSLFTAIIDNSAWLEPVYLTSNRYLFKSYGKMILQIKFDYLAKEILLDKKALNLNTIYKNFDNQAEILVFQGTNDNQIDYKEKEIITSKVNNTSFILIDEKDVDNNIFYSNQHGLDADFLKLFNLAYSKLEMKKNLTVRKKFDKLKFSNTTITIDHSQALPFFQLTL
ncbi:DUF2920 family protein [Rummeliibacillus pycnus]|uniref:DUF2920 family protein n=1 Tax=Rummeliibacillus pycnus TaxID=101070 RepID=UPI000C9A154D|nr:DUF2920 family protein [Rummeliibacillus pycnus]